MAGKKEEAARDAWSEMRLEVSRVQQDRAGGRRGGGTCTTKPPPRSSRHLRDREEFSAHGETKPENSLQALQKAKSGKWVS